MTHVIGIKDREESGANIFWLLAASADDKNIVVVDPGKSHPILEYLKKNNLRPDSILITHHHGDHTAGIEDIIAEYHCPVLGPENEKIESITQAFTEGDAFDRAGIHFEVLSLPGHTLDHIGFIADRKHFFCGDVLFGCGCGRVFEGTAEQMHATLQKCAQLPPETLLYWGHEYTTANLAFASRIEPNNDALKQRLEETQKRLLEHNGIAAPITLAEELATNPFLRADRSDVREKMEELRDLKLSDPVEVFAALRLWRNEF